MGAKYALIPVSWAWFCCFVMAWCVLACGGCTTYDAVPEEEFPTYVSGVKAGDVLLVQQDLYLSVTEEGWFAPWRYSLRGKSGISANELYSFVESSTVDTKSVNGEEVVWAPGVMSSETKVRVVGCVVKNAPPAGRRLSVLGEVLSGRYAGTTVGLNQILRRKYRKDVDWTVVYELDESFLRK